MARGLRTLRELTSSSNRLLPWDLRDFFVMDADKATDFVGGSENKVMQPTGRHRQDNRSRAQPSRHRCLQGSIEAGGGHCPSVRRPGHQSHRGRGPQRPPGRARPAQSGEGQTHREDLRPANPEDRARRPASAAERRLRNRTQGYRRGRRVEDPPRREPPPVFAGIQATEKHSQSSGR